MHKFVLICALLVTSSQAKSQIENNIKSALSHQPHLFVKLNIKNGFITNRNIKTIGVIAGIRYQKQISFGLELRKLLTHVETKNYHINNHDQPLDLKLYYFSLSPGVEYTYFASKKWQISIPVQFSFGKAFYKDQYKRKLLGGFMITYEPGISASYFLTDFLSFGLGIGYRLVLYKDKQIFDHFTAPTYQLKTGIYFGKIYQMVFNKK